MVRLILVSDVCWSGVSILPLLTICIAVDKLLKDNPKVSSSNLMAYIGGHESWTPCHFDHCGSIGHNLMTWADTGKNWAICLLNAIIGL